MKSFVGVTDQEWFNLLSITPNLEEVNFWQPSGRQHFRALNQGELFLFKLHSPNNYIVGGGLFAHSTLLPISLAWESFGVANGARSFSEMRKRVAKYRRIGEQRGEDYTIGCILLEQPFFLPHEKWIPVPSDWKPNIVSGRSYDLSVEPGKSILSQLEITNSQINVIRERLAQYGSAQLIYPRLGQGSFRILVTDAYERRCAITHERTLPALEAAHIKPLSENGPLSVQNGILLRRDIHALFDRGYITITPGYQIEVSRKIKEEFENGREYYRFHGGAIRLPNIPSNQPDHDYLEWHNTNIYKG